ncbi:ABC transporter permease [Bifidobacterium oedipodis]|uniref:Macrolide ABC transporter ATP-binding protein n=1 Tax=Bifidobacterium oedipodis TaxID=2675322 RepID=A0A7Y0ESU4_9BIFI|nr:ABC transporter permease [Bifidobacterium sp. DSM 109957]NMM94706.1 macrolide ABC transporter ATP-binding protein [Bifidobacterium sp. DSM 109957]
MTNPVTCALLALARRWRRNLLSMLAVLFCAATLVALQGIGLASGDRTAQRFLDMEDSTVEVTLPTSAWELNERELTARLDGIAQVIEAGTLNIPDGSGVSLDVSSTAWGISVSASAAIASMEGLEARGAALTAGLPLPPDEDPSNDHRIVLLGTRLARQLGITMAQPDAAVDIGGVRLRVTGTIQDADGRSALSTAVIMGPDTARMLGILPMQRVMHVAVEDGSVTRVAQALPVALLPSDPETVAVRAPSDPARLRAGLLEDSETTAGIITGVMVGVTAFSIINTMQMAVSERRREIGISLALGMPAWHIAAQFLLEAMLLGLAGGMLGMFVGAQAAAVIAYANGWRFLLPVSVLGVPVLGAVAGAVSGTLPAVQATKVNPAELLRST